MFGMGVAIPLAALSSIGYFMTQEIKEAKNQYLAEKFSKTNIRRAPIIK